MTAATSRSFTRMCVDCKGCVATRAIGDDPLCNACFVDEPCACGGSRTGTPGVSARTMPSLSHWNTTPRLKPTATPEAQALVAKAIRPKTPAAQSPLDEMPAPQAPAPTVLQSQTIGQLPSFEYMPIAMMPESRSCASPHILWFSELKKRGEGVCVRGRFPDHKSLEAFRDRVTRLARKSSYRVIIRRDPSEADLYWFALAKRIAKQEGDTHG